MIKTCSKCLQIKDISEFSIVRASKTGYKSSCKICTNIRSKELRIIKKPLKVYPIKSKDQKRKEASLKKQIRINSDPLFKFKCNVRTLLYLSFKRSCKGRYRKSEKTETLLGCSLIFFSSYIESLFSDGMTFENYGKWHLDHIIPINRAKTQEDVISLNHYTNLQPLWAKDNIIKSCR